MRAAWLALAACGGSSAATVDASPDAPALVAPSNTWTFLPQAGTTCGDGSPAGLALDPADGSTDLLVYFEGGGACWDENTCFTIKSAVYIDTPYDEATFQTELPAISAFPPFHHDDPTFGAATFVYIPYCTGDIHAGTAVEQYGAHTVHHTGGTNALAFITALRATYPQTTRIWLMGSSAGGYGATIQLGNFADAWPGAEVHVLQDSALFVPDMLDADAKIAAWKPAGFTNQADVMTSLEAAHPNSRIGLLTFDDDATLEAFMGYAKGSLAAAIDTLVAADYGKSTTHVFELPGTTHTMLGQYATLSDQGTPLSTWVRQWATGDPAWATLK